MTQTIPQPAPLLPVNHATDRPLRVVLTIIAFLATLALLASRMSTRSYDNWQADLSGFATIQIMPVGEGDRERAASQALNALSGLSVTRLSDEKARALLNPWIGETALPDGISLPVILQVQDSDKASLEAALSNTDLSFLIEDNKRWQSDITRTENRIAWASRLILLLVIGASVAITMFATQSAVAAEAITVNVFTQVGASDTFIATLFVKRALRIGMVAAVLGAVLAAIFALILSLIGRGESLLLPTLSLAPNDGLALIILVCVLTILGALATGASVRQILKAGRRRL